MNDRDKAIEILSRYAGAPWVEHCYAVAIAALAIGEAATAAHEVDLDLLWSTALLHDIGRSVTHDPVLHGIEGYRLLTSMGHPEAAYVCASHVLFGLDSAEAVECGLPARDFRPRTLEERVVPLADLLIEFDTPTTLERRFESLRARNGSNEWFSTRLDRAHSAAMTFMSQLEKDLDTSIEALVAGVVVPNRHPTL